MMPPSEVRRLVDEVLFTNVLEGAFSEVRIAPVQHLCASLAELGCLEGYDLTRPDFLIIPLGRALSHGGSWPIGPGLCGMRPLRAGCSSVAVLWSPGSFLYQTLTIFTDYSQNPGVCCIHYVSTRPLRKRA
jgi:hypothetical protein